MWLATMDIKIKERDKPFYIVMGLLIMYGAMGFIVAFMYPEYFKEYLVSLIGFVNIGVGYYLAKK